MSWKIRENEENKTKPWSEMELLDCAECSGHRRVGQDGDLGSSSPMKWVFCEQVNLSLSVGSESGLFTHYRWQTGQNVLKMNRRVHTLAAQIQILKQTSVHSAPISFLGTDDPSAFYLHRQLMRGVETGIVPSIRVFSGRGAACSDREVSNMSCFPA